MSVRLPAVLGALLCGLAVALGAYASHAADPLARPRFALAAAFAFGHGLALVALRGRAGRLALLSRYALLCGALLFSGSLAWAAARGGHAPLAPAGGMLLILGWLLAAVDLSRKD